MPATQPLTEAEAIQFVRRIESAAMLRHRSEKLREQTKALDPGEDWPIWMLDDRTFRVSPDGKQAVELGQDALCSSIDPHYVVKYAIRVEDPEEAYERTIGPAVVRGLNKGVLAEAKAEDPAPNWSIQVYGHRIFRVSPNRSVARELMPDGYWRTVDINYVLRHARKLPLGLFRRLRSERSSGALTEMKWI